MRAVVAIKSSSGRGTSRATRYISERDRDPQREGTGPRPLFSEREDRLSYRGADRLLNGAPGAPDKDDLIHFSVSFQQEDYERLGPTDTERKEHLREAAREAIGELKADVRAKDLCWVAGIHLNTDHPHVHVLVHKEIIDRETGKARRLARIPKQLLPSRETRADGSTRPVEGRLGGHFVAALDRQIGHAREQAGRGRRPERGHEETRGLGQWLRAEVKARSASDSWSAPARDRLSNDSETRHDRVVLGEAVEKGARREYAALVYERALAHGESFRFRVHDESVEGQVRQISETDVQRRADARGVRAADERHVPVFERRELRRQVAEHDVARHAETIEELREIRSSVLHRLQDDLVKATHEEQRAGEGARIVEQKYRSDGRELPTPFIKRETLVELQEQAINHGLAERVVKMEELRVALAREHNQPVRTDQEAARLGAQLFTARTEMKAKSGRVSHFDETCHLRRWEVGGERWSLSDLDRKLQRRGDEAKVFGAYRFHFDPRARRQAGEEAARLSGVREEVVRQIDERRGALRNEADGARRLVEVLTSIHTNERESRAREGRAMPAPEFTREEMLRVEASAEMMRDAGVLRQLRQIEKSSDGRAGATQGVAPEDNLRRWMAREIMAEVAHRESAERLDGFRERGEAQPLVVRGSDGRLTIHTLRETKPRSVVERILRPLLEKPHARETREAVQAASASYYNYLLSDHDKSRTYLQAAREITDGLRTEARLQRGSDKNRPTPTLTAKERINLEIYGERQANPQDREHYLSLARGETAERRSPGEEAVRSFARGHAGAQDINHVADRTPAHSVPSRSTARGR